MRYNLNSLSTIATVLAALFFSTICVAENKQLQVVTELSPPHQTLIDNEVSGSTTKIVNALLAASDISATINMYPWARAYKKALSEPNTLIYSMAKSEERNELFHWLLPVVSYKFGLVGLSDRADLDITNLKDVSKFTIAIQRGDIAHHWAIRQGLEEGKELIICSDIGCSWQLLINKKVDFIIDSPELIEGMLVQHKLPTTFAKYIIAIPELELTGYLATNKNIETNLLETLRLTIKNGVF